MMVAALALALNGCGHEAVAPHAISFAAADGYPLSGTLYPVVRSGAAPGIIFLHDSGSDSGAWEAMAFAASASGYVCLAIDFRGHGSSRRDGDSYRSFGAEDWGALGDDLEGAYSALVKHGGDGDNIAVVGAGLGANVALIHAGDADWIQGVVAVSPGLEFKGLRVESAMGALAEKPVLLIAAEGDSYAASTCARLREIAAGFCEVRTYPGTSFGTDLITLSRGAREQIVQWLDGVIGLGYGRVDDE